MKYIKTYEQINKSMIDENKIYALIFSWHHLSGEKETWHSRDLIIGKIKPYYTNKYLVSGYNMNSEENKGKKINYVIEDLKNVREATQPEIDFFWWYENMNKK